MSIIEAILLGIVQGLTEFIPVSSSGHLVLGQELFGISGGGLRFDVALHMGTLLALLVYFARDIIDVTRGFFKGGDQARLGKILLYGTIPAAIIGYFLQDIVETGLRNAYLVVVNLALVGLVMLYAEHRASKTPPHTDISEVTVRQSVAIGFAQAAALIPGVSRSGSTITLGLLLGMKRVAATRFSFLLAIPITLGAIIKTVVIDSQPVSNGGDSGLLLAGVFAAFVSGVFAIRFLLQFLARHSLKVFAYYRLGFAGLVLVVLLIR
ncbi:undecaprenyl-diphosphate phosphatase [soil metagenome]